MLEPDAGLSSTEQLLRQLQAFRGLMGPMVPIRATIRGSYKGYYL